MTFEAFVEINSGKSPLEMLSLLMDEAGMIADARSHATLARYCHRNEKDAAYYDQEAEAHTLRLRWLYASLAAPLAAVSEKTDGQNPVNHDTILDSKTEEEQKMIEIALSNRDCIFDSAAFPTVEEALTFARGRGGKYVAQISRSGQPGTSFAYDSDQDQFSWFDGFDWQPVTAADIADRFI